jgi:3-dehydroquinate dehydratase/shikimate dehydrogenase
MLSVPVKGPTFESARSQIAKAQSLADILELRLDLFAPFDPFSEGDFQQLRDLQHRSAVPFMFTLRSKRHGGAFTLSDNEQQQWLAKLATLTPAYIDIEDHLPNHFAAELHAKYPHTKIIISHHDFEKTPLNLEEVYSNMRRAPAWGVKIATMARSPLETLRLLTWAKEAISQKENVIPIAMGEHGTFGRIIAPIIGSPITYASLTEELSTAPGQLSVEILQARYHYRALNPHTAIFALLGGNVSESISDETHNAFFEIHHLDAVYVKIAIQAHLLKPFLLLAKSLPFRGFSITMPLKEVAILAMDEISPAAIAIGAVNTATLWDGHWIGSNTDGIGALNAIETFGSVKGKRTVIIGAGGAAKAIAFEAARRGALLTIVTRVQKHAELLAAKLSAQSAALSDMYACADAGYDILINATPAAMPINCACILPNTIVMDVKTKPKETEFLKCAMQKGCSIVYGYEMFLQQAIGQLELWFENRIRKEAWLASLESIIGAVMGLNDTQEKRD